jgi:putative tricarboxylic transport membrane protein
VAGRSRDVVVAAAFAVLALIFVVAGRNLPFEARGIPGPGLFPLLVAATILAFSAALAVHALRPRRSERTPAPGGPIGAETMPGRDDETAAAAGAPGEEQRSVLRALLLWGVALLACVALPAIGFLPAMLLLTFSLLVGLERRFDVVSLVSAVTVPVACYVLFGFLLDVRLPTGLFG